ncbi:hypothetical protein [Bacillus sp. UNC41MFS5]|uniref:hypothetical protein n=1 Tax=Bacillus sp. UNC41MFS5 TaxID=1449046 RepID=UPI00068A9991|nr:hypothetical protein [Bacillus sp. UNC41MFS5]
MKGNRNEVEPSHKLFEGERGLVLTGMIGFILSAGIALYIYFQGSIKAPEGNLRDAFSFNAAIGMFLLSMAAILPLTRFKAGRRKAVRWSFIMVSLYSYTIETVQNFRGISPRFSREGTVVDTAAGMLFGVVSLVLVFLAMVLVLHFFRLKRPYERPLLLLGIRYAFLSVLAANFAGIWMIFLQDRLTGDGGNVIVLHGFGFHALQTLILLAWLLEKAQVSDRIKKRLIHSGCIAWMLSILLIGIQTALGRTVFELTPLPFLGILSLLVWFGTLIIACVFWIKQWKITSVTANQLPLMKENK